jgi:hypothetical protein
LYYFLQWLVTRSHLLKITKQMQVQQYIAQTPAKALDIDILVWLVGFDMVYREPIGFLPVNADPVEELRAIVSEQHI